MVTFYVDLDRTLFRTERAEEIFSAIEKAYPHNDTIRGGYDKRRDYYVFPHKGAGDEATYYHDLARQLQAAGLEPQRVFADIQAALADGRFEYPGADELIRLLRSLGEVNVLTYGEDIYQRFKASLCPSLGGVAVTTIISPKSDYLNLHAAVGDWIIDDKQIEGLKPGVHAVHLQHGGKMPADAHSLAGVAKVITERLSPNGGATIDI